jgi:hypothetical protein
MMAESIVSVSPIALLQHWITTLRRAMSTDKHEIGSAEIEYVDHSKHRHKGTVNTLLVVACIVFGAASFMFGYDDKVISPIIALPAFVSLALCRSTFVSDTNWPPGGNVPRW